MNICKTFFLFLILFLSLSIPASAEQPSSVTVGNATFTAEMAQVLRTALPFRKALIAQPLAGFSKKPALVVYLHGGSSKGNDNVKPMSESGIDSIATYLVGHQLESIMVVPQCPSDKSWGGTMNAILAEWINGFISRGEVDADRIYIFGGSMGGTGTWGMVSAYPQLFAAAMPVAADPSRCLAENVAKTPAFTVMGTNDAIMSMDKVDTFVDQLKSLGADVKYEIEEGLTHEETCIQSYTTSRLDWVFSHTRSNMPDGVQQPLQTEAPVHVEYYSVVGQRLAKPTNGQVCLKASTYNDGHTDTQKILY